MNRRRPFPRPGPALLLAALFLTIPSRGSAISVTLYPLDEGTAVRRATIARLHELMIDGLWQVSSESEWFEPREPVLRSPGCGRTAEAKVECLARLAGKGVLVFGEIAREGDTFIVTLRLVDGRGRVSPESWFRMSPLVLASGPVVHALRELRSALARGRLERPRAPEPRSAVDPAAPSEVLPGWREKPPPPHDR